MDPSVSQNMTIKALLDQYPDLLNVFIELGLLCPGCPAEAFHTVEDVAREYGYDMNTLIQHIHKTLNSNNQKDILGKG